jgi:acetylornithine deacetylase/succinyl-diaminopimelate desuccinylase-like protein
MTPHVHRSLALLALFGLAARVPAQLPTTSALPAAYQRLAREVLTEAVNTNTTASVGSTTALATKLRARLLEAGYAPGDIHIVGPDAKNQNLIVRLRGRQTGKRPILLAAHLDVVEANRADWTADPFALRLENGLFLGRGAEDDKSGVAVIITNLIRWKREHWTPDRDVIALFMTRLDRLPPRYFPGAPVIPSMALGASDGLYLRNAGIPTYSLSAIAEADGESNAHGLNEKVRERSVYDATAFWNDMVRGLAGGDVP